MCCLLRTKVESKTCLIFFFFTDTCCNCLRCCSFMPHYLTFHVPVTNLVLKEGSNRYVLCRTYTWVMQPSTQQWRATPNLNYPRIFVPKNLDWQGFLFFTTIRKKNATGTQTPAPYNAQAWTTMSGNNTFGPLCSLNGKLLIQLNMDVMNLHVTNSCI